MSIENKKTLEVYDKMACKYMETGILHDNLDIKKAEIKRNNLQNLIKNNLEIIPKGKKVLEIGSANGDNAKYIESLGYNITASDVAKDFIEASKRQNLNVIKFNVLEDKLKDKYDAVFCWRVFVHFTIEDISDALKNIYDSLNDGGIFIFNVMNRAIKDVDEEWVDFDNEYHMGAMRFYKYFEQEQLDIIINKIGYNIYNFHKEGGKNNDKWLIYVLQK